MTIDLDAIRGRLEEAGDLSNLEVNGNAVHQRFKSHYAECIAIFHGEQRRQRAAWFAHAPQDLMALLAELSSARADNARLREALKLAEEEAKYFKVLWFEGKERGDKVMEELRNDLCNP